MGNTQGIIDCHPERDDGSTPEAVVVDIREGAAHWELRQPWWYTKPFGKDNLPPNFSAVVYAFGQPVACARVFFPLQVLGRGLSMKAAGIGGVFTREDARRRGFGMMAVNKCIELARDLECAAAALYARDEVAPMYLRGGFYRAKAFEAESPGKARQGLYLYPVFEGLRFAESERWEVHPATKF